MSRETIKMGLLGLGTVGSGTIRILSENEKGIAGNTRADLNVAQILVRDMNKSRPGLPDGLPLTDDPERILSDPEIEIVVEVLGGIHPAKEYIARALEKGKYVVTANKDLMAKHGAELLTLAKLNGRNIFYEASVGGGIPLIQPLKLSLAANRIERLVGIVNGTTNYILTQMTNEDKEFAEALQEAQAKGFAEQDPSSDVDGLDAAYKLTILARLAFQKNCTVEHVNTETMRKVQLRDIQCARELGYVIKLLAIAESFGSSVSLSVHPALVPIKHPLANINNEFNAVFVQGNAVGEVMFYGPGAGSLPTGSAVVGDIMEAARCIHYKMRSGVLETHFTPVTIYEQGEQLSRFYLRFQALDQPGVFAALAIAFGDASVSLDRIIQQSSKRGIAEIVLVTHRVREKQFFQAMEAIERLPSIQEISAVIRLLEEEKHEVVRSDSEVQVISSSLQ